MEKRDNMIWVLEMTKKGIKWIKRRGFSHRLLSVKTPEIIERLAQSFPKGNSSVGSVIIRMQRYERN